MRNDKQKGWFYNQHSCFLLQYHLLFVTKYRHPVRTGEVKEFVYSYLKEKMEAYGLYVMAMSGEPDHVHILFEAPPNIELAKMINALKTVCSRMTLKNFTEQLAPYYWTVCSRMTLKNFTEQLAPYYWKPVFWSMSYFICTVSDRNAEVLRRYIQDQDIR